jgi:cytochrome c oxidase subunit 1
MTTTQTPINNAGQWLKLGMIAVALATLLAVLLIAGKTPLLSSLLPDENSFQRALVLHVDLNMTLWVGAIACFFWGATLDTWINRMGAWMATAGFALWIFAYLIPSAPILNNYMPVFDTPSYFLGLVLIIGSFCWMALQWLLHQHVNGNSPENPSVLAWSKSVMALLLLSAVANALISMVLLEMQMHDARYFEQLFWGPGHIWQLFALQVMVTAWLYFMPDTQPMSVLERWLWKVPIIGAIAGLLIPVVIHPDTDLYRALFTHYMRFGSLWVLPIVLRIYSQRGDDWLSPQRLSGSLFILGLVIGTLIRNDNLMVPAHYHAMTGAVNLAIMAYVMHRLTTNAGSLFIVKLQMTIYSVGVFLLATGLAWSGLLGGMRKLTLAAQLVDDWQHLAVLTLMGLGGLMAIGGIFLFLGISLSFLRKKTGIFRPISLEHARFEAK